MIDLRVDMAHVRELLIEGLAAFGTEHTRTRASMFAVYSCPCAGWLLLSLDTKEHCDAHVAKWAAKYASRGMKWTGADEFGQFCDNAPDFAFRGWRDLEMPHWKAEYEGPSRVIIGLDGRTHTPSTANDDYNRVFFEALVPTVHGLERHPPFQGSPWRRRSARPTPTTS